MFDVIVIGGGAVGLATALNLSKLQIKTMLVEQLTCPNTRGSSSGQSRQLSYHPRHELLNYLTTLAADEWKQLEESLQVSLLMESKKICMGPPAVKSSHHGSGQNRPKRKAVRGLKYNNCQFIGEYDGWILKAVKCLQALKSCFLDLRGTLMEQEKVIGIRPIHDQRVEVHTSKGMYLAKSVIMACGAWTNQLLRPLEIQLPLKVYRYQVAYFKTSRFPMYEYEANFPIVSLSKDEPSSNNNDAGISTTATPIYEYPNLMKVEIMSEGVEVEADRRDRELCADDEDEEEYERELMERMKDQISLHLPHLDTQPSIVETNISCEVNDGFFVIDRHPDYDNVIIGCGFGAHQFTLAPVIGKLMSSLALSRDLVDVETGVLVDKFSLRRFQSLTDNL